jgi:small subunit ribosomal protein S21
VTRVVSVQNRTNFTIPKPGGAGRGSLNAPVSGHSSDHARHNASQFATKGVSSNQPAQVRKNAGCGGVSLAEIRLQEGESIESALRRFKRKVQTEDIIKEVKRHSYYLKPGAKRRVKQALAQQRARKKLRKEALSSNR